MRKCIVFMVSLVLFCSANAMASPSLHINRTVYVSSSEGNDRNPGTIDKPVKTIASIGTMKDVRILLKRGDVFFEKVNNLSGSELGAYGSGEKPILSGFRVLKNTHAWKKYKGNVWRLEISNDENFVGFMSTNASDVKNFTNIGVIYDWKKDKIYANMVSAISSLKENMDYFVADKYIPSKLTKDTFRYLYLYYDGNPAELGNIAFTVYTTGAWNVNNSIISNVSFIGWGAHGINIINNSDVSDCDFDIIGGSLHNTGTFLRLGNGIQVWVSDSPVKNVLVSGCQITRTFDTATTIQGTSQNVASAENIVFKGNRIAYCRQAFERYLHNGNNSKAQYINCSFNHNIVYKSGDNMFGLPYQGNNVHLLSYENDSKPIDISKNVFLDGNYYFASNFSSGIHDNIVYVYDGQYLNNEHGRDSYIMAQDNNSSEKYRLRTGDSSKIIKLTRGSSKETKVIDKVLADLNLTFHKFDFTEFLSK